MPQVYMIDSSRIDSKFNKPVSSLSWCHPDVRISLCTRVTVKLHPVSSSKVTELVPGLGNVRRDDDFANAGGRSVEYHLLIGCRHLGVQWNDKG